MVANRDRLVQLVLDPVVVGCDRRPAVRQEQPESTTQKRETAERSNHPTTDRQPLPESRGDIDASPIFRLPSPATTPGRHGGKATFRARRIGSERVDRRARTRFLDRARRVLDDRGRADQHTGPNARPPWQRVACVSSDAVLGACRRTAQDRRFVVSWGDVVIVQKSVADPRPWERAVRIYQPHSFAPASKEHRWYPLAWTRSSMEPNSTPVRPIDGEPHGDSWYCPRRLRYLSVPWPSGV